MGQYSKFERPYAIRNAAGLIVYESAAFPWGIEAVTNSETSATIGRGEAVRIDVTNSVFPRWDYSTAGTDTPPYCVIKGLRVSALSNAGWIGVATQDIPVGKEGPVLTLGIVAVKCINPPTSNTVGAMIVGSATAGSVTAMIEPLVKVPAVGPPQTYGFGMVLGSILVPAGTSAGQSGSLTQLIAKLGAGA